MRLWIVSNRLPITAVCRSEGGWEFKKSSGGLVSALAGVHGEMEFNWIGWPGCQVEKSGQAAFESQLISEHACYPVFLSEESASRYYSGFSNGALWPLLHYLPGEIEYEEQDWIEYMEVNRAFSERIAELAQNEDIIWVHDYHLLLVPAMLRGKADQSVQLRIGLFLHTPFPSSEIFRAQPGREQILTCLLEADVLGFQTYDYLRHFQTACSRILGANTTLQTIDYRGRKVRTLAQSVGVEPASFQKELGEQRTLDRIAVLRSAHCHRDIIVGVDRLDYIKGITQKLLGFDHFLHSNPEYIGKVVLLQVAIPTRSDVPEYQRLQSTVFEAVGRINGKYSTADYTPIHLIFNSIDFPELVALYGVARACLITSVRDGLNLVAFEYVAAQENQNGSLILSEFAGAAQSFSGAITFNPWDLDAVSNAIRTALQTPSSRRGESFSMLRKYVDSNTSARWGAQHLKELLLLPKLAGNSLGDLGAWLSQSVPESTKKIVIVECSEKKADLAQLLDIAVILDQRGIQLYASVFEAAEPETSTDKAKLLGLVVDGGASIKVAGACNFERIDFKLDVLREDGDILEMLNYYEERLSLSKTQSNTTAIILESSLKKRCTWALSELLLNVEKLFSHLPIDAKLVSETMLLVSLNHFWFCRIASEVLSKVTGKEQTEIVIVRTLHSTQNILDALQEQSNCPTLISDDPVGLVASALSQKTFN